MSTRRIVIPELEAAPEAEYTFWSMEQKIALASYYGIKDPEAVAKYLGKGTGKMQSQAKKLGVYYGMTDDDREEVIRKIEAGLL